MDLQVYPPIKRRTPMHPGCGANRTQWGISMRLTDLLDREDFLAGRGLELTTQPWVVKCAGKIVGYHPDPHYALGWVVAARNHGLVADMYRQHSLAEILKQEWDAEK